MSRYTPITLDEMKEVLQEEKGWQIVDVSGYEYVFGFEVPSCPGLNIRVHSSISKHTGKGRKKGADAIRVSAVFITPKKNHRGVHKQARVLRVEGWRKNLRERATAVIEESIKRYHNFGMGKSPAKAGAKD